VLRARSGRLTEAEAWDELDAGFERGRRDKSDLTLSDLSMRMGRLGHYMRGYWSGTALVMMADVELRTRRDDPSSLDAALNAYLACCRAHEEEAEPDAFLAELDRQVGGEVFSTLYRRLASQSEFPDLADTYRKLGLRHATPKVSIDDTDEDTRRLRTGIMRGTAPAQGDR
jgi:predicted metalloprotease with PDZ domain